MSTVGERIAKRRKELGLSQEELAKMIGYSGRFAISKIEKGTNQLRQNKVRPMASALGVTIGYIMGDEEEPKKAPSVLNVPVYDPLSCGTGIDVAEEPDDMIGLPTKFAKSGIKYFSNPAEGDSMEPGIHSGDYLVFEETDHVQYGQVGSFSLNGQYFCKRLKLLSDGSIWLFSDNAAYDPIAVRPTDDFRVLGLYKYKLSKEQ